MTANDDQSSLDALDQIHAAYGKRAPTLRPRPETVGLAITLLVNRNTAPERALRRWSDDGQRTVDACTDPAVCIPAERFAVALGDPVPSGWRGGGVAGLRCLLGPAAHVSTLRGRGIATKIWVEDDPARLVVSAWLAKRHDSSVIDRAFDDLIEATWPYAPALAAYGNLHERPGHTTRLRTALTTQRAA